MDQKGNSSSLLFVSSVFEPREELEEKLSRCYNAVTDLIRGLSDRETNDSLNSHVAKGSAEHEEVQFGLLYSILTEPQNALKRYRDLSLVNRDGLNIVLNTINQIIFEKWLKLQEGVKSQILWLCKELVKNSVASAESACYSLMRQIAGGDVTTKNIWLIDSLVDLFSENRTWLEKSPGLVASVVYTFLRIIVDHTAPNLAHLRQKEVDLCIVLLRERFSECLVIGRDLVRVLQYVARIPEIEKFWKDLLMNPSSLCPNFTGVQQLLQTRTSRKFLISRLTPDMENKLMFILTKVKFGQQRRYQEWLQRQYLSTAESQSLRCDLIRYICAVFHPSNELLCSDIIPRWALIGWLLTTCTSNVAASNAKLALFYDWFFFDPERDSIMNIEPAILVMFHSMRPHPAITATLLDFLCRILTNFSPDLTTAVKHGIYTSLRSIVEKRVLPSLSPLFDNTKLDGDLRKLIRETFPEFCSAEIKEESVAESKEDLCIELDNGNHIGENNISEAAFSDEEDEPPISKEKITSNFRPIREPPRCPSVDIMENISNLPDNLKDITEELVNEKDQEVQCELMDRLIQIVVMEEEFYSDTASLLATCLCQILSGTFSSNIFPAEVDDESVEDSIGSPLFVMFRFLSQMPEEDPSRHPLLLLLSEMYDKEARIGYHLLYFLKVSKNLVEDKMSTYKDFTKSLDGRDLQTSLMSDLKLCQEDDVRLFTFLIPDIYTQFSSIAIGNSDLLNMIVSCIDGTQLQDLICEILQGHLVMFRKDSFLSVLNSSLEWETLEQYFLWQLISAHNIPVEFVLPILPKLEFSSHAEALTSILVLLKQECPIVDLVRPVLCRDSKKNDFFSISILKYWAQEYEDRLAEVLMSQLSKLNGTPKKRQRTGSSAKKENTPTVDQILSHLDHMRQVCRNVSFLNHEQIQYALRQVQQTATESLKTKFSDLLALADDIEDMKITRNLRGRRASNNSPKDSRSKKTVLDSESESESSEDDDLKPKAKKRKKGVVVDDDSD